MSFLRRNWSDRNRDITSLNLIVTADLHDRFMRLAERFGVNAADLAGQALTEFTEKQESTR